MGNQEKQIPSRSASLIKLGAELDAELKRNFRKKGVEIPDGWSLCFVHPWIIALDQHADQIRWGDLELKIQDGIGQFGEIIQRSQTTIKSRRKYLDGKSS